MLAKMVEEELSFSPTHGLEYLDILPYIKHHPFDIANHPIDIIDSTTFTLFFVSRNIWNILAPEVLFAIFVYSSLQLKNLTSKCLQLLVDCHDSRLRYCWLTSRFTHFVHKKP